MATCSTFPPTKDTFTNSGLCGGRAVRQRRNDEEPTPSNSAS
jgi:hypothetical protein